MDLVILSLTLLFFVLSIHHYFNPCLVGNFLGNVVLGLLDFISLYIELLINWFFFLIFGFSGSANRSMFRFALVLFFASTCLNVSADFVLCCGICPKLYFP